MKTLKKLLDLLAFNERKKAVLLLGMILVMALLDMLGVASILPFMAVLANPEMIETNAFLNSAFKAVGNFGIDSGREFLVALGLLVFVLLLVSLAFKALTMYAQLRFAHMREYSIGQRFLEGYIYQPYGWFVTKNSAILTKTILSEVQNIVDNGIRPMMMLIANSAVAIALLILLVLIDPMLALTMGLALTLSYLLIFKITHSYLDRIGRESLAANAFRFTAVSEAFGAIKEVKVGGLEDIYIQRFACPAILYAQNQAYGQLVGQLPRFALEAIAFGGMLLVLLYHLLQGSDIAHILPVITLYAFAGYRLMPALQQIYGSIVHLRFVSSALDELHTDFLSLQSAKKRNVDGVISYKNTIELESVFYCHPNNVSPFIKNLNLKIPYCSTVGIVGSTGSGKSTTVDLIMGLLSATSGALKIDGIEIHENNARAWQQIIGYVPQQIYLADDTILGNIAFGVSPNEIDFAAVERSAKIANIHDFIDNELPQKYRTMVGERGVCLSGGQRQRIGIARAIYRNPKVLILDEATSALDTLTELGVMNAIRKLGDHMTLVIIAHRLSTIKHCDQIFVLDKGEIQASGTFEQLMQSSEPFRRMISSD